MYDSPRLTATQAAPSSSASPAKTAQALMDRTRDIVRLALTPRAVATPSKSPVSPRARVASPRRLCTATTGTSPKMLPPMSSSVPPSPRHRLSGVGTLVLTHSPARRRGATPTRNPLPMSLEAAISQLVGEYTHLSARGAAHRASSVVDMFRRNRFLPTGDKEFLVHTYDANTNFMSSLERHIEAATMQRHALENCVVRQAFELWTHCRDLNECIAPVLEHIKGYERRGTASPARRGTRTMPLPRDFTEIVPPTDKWRPGPSRHSPARTHDAHSSPAPRRHGDTATSLSGTRSPSNVSVRRPSFPRTASPAPKTPVGGASPSPSPSTAPLATPPPRPGLSAPKPQPPPPDKTTIAAPDPNDVDALQRIRDDMVSEHGFIEGQRVFLAWMSEQSLEWLRAVRSSSTRAVRDVQQTPTKAASADGNDADVPPQTDGPSEALLGSDKNGNTPVDEEVEDGDLSDNEMSF
eukprot:PhM_4_TR15064/c0_g1_i1/m.2222